MLNRILHELSEIKAIVRQLQGGAVVPDRNSSVSLQEAAKILNITYGYAYKNRKVIGAYHEGRVLKVMMTDLEAYRDNLKNKSKRRFSGKRANSESA